MTPPRRVADVIVLAAITLELEEARRVEAGAWPGSVWERGDGPNGLPLYFRTYRGKNGSKLRVALAQPGDMGAVAATSALVPLALELRPRVIAMCGVCAGRPGKTNLGDVIAAERLFFHDAGKKLPGRVAHDIETYNLRKDWKIALEHFGFLDRFRGEDWMRARPLPLEWQESWVLAKLAEGVADPSKLPERENACAQWREAIHSLWKTGALADGTLTLTEAGRKRIQRMLIEHGGFPSDLSPSSTVLPWRAHVAALGSGSEVIEDPAYWGIVTSYARKTLALEMEGAALGAMKEAQRDLRLDAIVMKGVMDFAQEGRDDHFKQFAARASAECLFAFLREHVEPAAHPDLDDILVSGRASGTPGPSSPPSAFLQARYEVVAFRGREQVLADLDAWAQTPPSVAARLIHADGGVGKTRLGIEWVRRLRERGVAAGFLARPVPDDWFDRACTIGTPVVAVLDYAETRADLRAVLRRALRATETPLAHRVRLLLLARNDGDWWRAVTGSDAALGEWLTAVPPLRLEPLAEQSTDRDAVFAEAAAAFAAGRGRPIPAVRPDLSGEPFDRVLYVHMAALAAVDGVPFAGQNVMDETLKHEERFWEDRAQDDDLAVDALRTKARQLVVAATLRGGFTGASDAQAIATRLGFGDSTERDRLLLLLHRVYQRGSDESYIPRLEPDLLGEHMTLHLACMPPGAEGAPPRDWIPRLFPASDDESAISNAFEVLGRASSAVPTVARRWLDDLVGGDPFDRRALLAFRAAKSVGMRAIAFDLGEALAARLQARGDARIAAELDDDGVPHPTVALARVATWISGIRLHDAEESSAALEDRARRLTAHAAALDNVGRSEEAFAPARDAVEVYRILAAREPARFLPELATTLVNLGISLSRIGKAEEALVPVKEAIDLYEAESVGGRVAISLGSALNVLAGISSDLGRAHDAFRAAERAVLHYREVVKVKGDRFTRELAGSLMNLATCLLRVGERDRALTTGREALELLRRLAKADADAGLPTLAMHLHNFGNVLTAVGRPDEALAVAQEAVGVLRLLASRNPENFQSNYASALDGLGARYTELHRWTEALSASQESLRVRRDLVRTRGDTHFGDLTASLTNVATDLLNLGRFQEAITTLEEAIDRARALVDRNRPAFLPVLATCLSNIGTALGEVGRADEGLAASIEGTELRRELARDNPGAFSIDLATSLHNLGNRLHVAGRRDEALAATREAVEIRRGLVEQHRDAFLPSLASSVASLVTRLYEAGSFAEALATSEEAVAIHRELAAHGARFREPLAIALHNQSAIVADTGRLDEALGTLNEAITIFRSIESERPDVVVPMISRGFGERAVLLARTGRLTEAVHWARQAVETIWPSFEREPERFRGDAAMMLQLAIDLHERTGAEVPNDFAARRALVEPSRQ